jgi:ribosomal protein L5
MKGLKHQYKTVVISKLLQEFQYKNIQQIPSFQLILVHW